MAALVENGMSLGEQAYLRLQGLVLSGQLHPGERVTERGLQDRTGFGASPVRDALARLDMEGLMITLPRRGYQVCPLTLQSIDDLFDVWRIIGPAMVALAYRRLGSKGLAQLRRRLLDSISADDTPVSAARKAWTGICLATENRHLIDTFSRLELHLARVLFLTSDHLDKVPSPGVGHHRSIVDTLQLKDVQEMEKQTTEFIDHFHEQVQSVLRRFPSVMSAELSFGGSLVP